MKLGDLVQSVGQSLLSLAQYLSLLLCVCVRVCVRTYVCMCVHVRMCACMCRYEEQTMREGSIHTSKVRVVNVSAALDYAVFSCTARNSLGEDKLDIQLVSTSTVSMYILCFLCVWVYGST